jgi:gentisate 1,2-dioxygenase
VSQTLPKESGDRRVALLAHPDLSGAMATEGLHAGIQLLLPGESAAPHRHSPGALRIGLEAAEIVTLVDDEEVRLDPLDVVLNPAGTWHGHAERGGGEAVWLDVVDLPLVASLGAVLFEPPGDPWTGDVLDPAVEVPAAVRYPWPEVAERLDAASTVDGVRRLGYGDGSVLPTLAVNLHAVDEGAAVALPPRTAGAVALVGEGTFELAGPPSDGATPSAVALDTFDVASVRAWTPATFTSRSGVGILFVVDTSPAAARLGLYREQRRR